MNSSEIVQVAADIIEFESRLAEVKYSCSNLMRVCIKCLLCAMYTQIWDDTVLNDDSIETTVGELSELWPDVSINVTELDFGPHTSRVLKIEQVNVSKAYNCFLCSING